MLSLRIVGLALTVAFTGLALSGCTSVAPEPTVDSTVAAILNPELVPHTLATVDETATQEEASRLADALAAVMDPATVVGVTDQSQLVAPDDDAAAYYVAYRTYLLDPSVDALTLAETLAAVLAQSGWTQHGTSTEGNLTIVALAGGSDDQPWFIFVQGDETIEGEPALSIELASPDL